MARPTADARYLNFVSMEQPYVDTLTLGRPLPNVMLAHPMDGAPLSRAHGAPLRLVVPRCTATRASSGSRIELVPTLARLLGAERLRRRRMGGRSNGY